MNYIKRPARNKLSREQLEASLLIKQERYNPQSKLNSEILSYYFQFFKESQQKQSKNANEDDDPNQEQQISYKKSDPQRLQKDEDDEILPKKSKS
jgi:hypothetical protein